MSSTPHISPERRAELLEEIGKQVTTYKNVSFSFHRPLVTQVDSEGHIFDGPGTMLIIEIRVDQHKKLEDAVETPDVHGESQAE